MQRKYLFPILLEIMMIFGSVISIIILPYDIDAQRPKQTLHEQTLDTIVKQTNLFKGNSQINVGASPSSIAINYDTNTVYVTKSDSDTVSAINETIMGMPRIFNTWIRDIPVGKLPLEIAINPNTNTVYVANLYSDGISVIDGVTYNVVAGVTFNINPADSGHITCNKIDSPINQYFYLFSGTTCTAQPNNGFEFSSWVENLKHNSTRTIKTSTVNGSSLNSFLDILGIKQNDNGATFNGTQFGSFTANFKGLSPAIPPEYLATLFGIMVGTFAPSVFRWLNGLRQRKNLRELVDRINSEHYKLDRITLENEIMGLYTKGKINHSHYTILKGKISEYYSDTKKE